MPRNMSSEVKSQAVKEYLEGKGNSYSVPEKYGVSRSSFKRWVTKYKAFGDTAFIRTGHNNPYTKEFKHMVANAYLNGDGSYLELAVKYKVPSDITIRCWVLKYNGHEKLKASGTGGSTFMTKGRTTTFDERVEIVQYCIAHNHNYTETAEKYQVSYQQSRSYTVKYEIGGVEALKDNRGKRKPEDELSELERLRAENRILRAEKQQAVMEASFLKKLGEIERRRD
jgi:transposase-like protein